MDNFLLIKKDSIKLFEFKIFTNSFFSKKKIFFFLFFQILITNFFFSTLFKPINLKFLISKKFKIVKDLLFIDPKIINKNK